ncbi:MAG: SCP2 sterol-binding domain-containing protein [Oligoflexia bacterium]|nr:SCP2 sterol-binding domain-containing protein [Oligoflexia bacterium]
MFLFDGGIRAQLALMEEDSNHTEITAVLARMAALLQTSEALSSAHLSTLRIELSDSRQSSWLFDPKSKVVLSDSSEQAACTITLSAADLVSIFSGKVNIQRAFLEGRVELRGDPGVLLAHTTFFANQGLLR